MKIVNGTSHQIHFYLETQCIAVQGGRKLIVKKGEAPIYTLPPGGNLNAQKSNKEAPLFEDAPMPLKGAVSFAGADPIPEGDIVVVSNLYRAACLELGRDTSTLAVVEGTVYDSETSLRPCGCLALAVG